MPATLAFCLSVCAHAAETAGAPALTATADDPVAAATGGLGETLASARRRVRDATVWLARGIDSRFGDRPFEEGGAVDDGRLSLRLGSRQSEGFAADLRFDARVRLPNLERQGYLFLGRDDPREVVSDRPGEVSRQALLVRQARAADPSFFAGLGLTLRHAVDFRLGFRGGLKPYAQARYRRSWTPTDVDRIELRETLFWSVDDRLGSTTTAAVSHAFSPTLAGRWLNSATITQVTERLEWSSILGTYKSLGGQRSFGVELIMNGTEGAAVPVSDYGLQLKWEQPVHEDWLLAEFIVGHFWPRDDAEQPRGSEWAVSGSLKLLF